MLAIFSIVYRIFDNKEQKYVKLLQIVKIIIMHLCRRAKIDSAHLIKIQDAI